MSSLEREIRRETSETFTENGDIAFTTTLNANLDFFASAGALRSRQWKVSELAFDALREDLELAIKNIFHLRNVRGGLGERDSFKTAYMELYRCDPETAIQLLKAVPEYGRWDDILILLDQVPEEVAKVVSDQLLEDISNMKAGKPVSLCAKWMPSPNTSSEETKREARLLYKTIGWSEKQYRQTLSALRGYIDILERHLSTKDYSFDYSKLPARALITHVKAFMREDKDRYIAYREALRTGVEKAKTATLYPHEIMNLGDADLRESMWRDIDRHPGDTKTIVVRDGSGSMTCNTYDSSVKPIDVATSLAILFAEQLTGDFKDKFITFSSRPKFVDLSRCKTLEEKIRVCNRENEITSTNIMAVYKLILNAEKRCDPKDWIERIVIISDMQFDVGTSGVPTYEEAKSMFEEARIPMPQIVYWNVNSRADFPSTDLQNVRLVSGYSQFIIEGVLKDTALDAVEFMKNELKKYDPVLKLINKDTRSNY